MRLKTIILTDLINRQLKYQESLERLMNSNDGDVNEQCLKINVLLGKLTLVEARIAKWQEITSNNNLLEEGNEKNEK